MELDIQGQGLTRTRRQPLDEDPAEDKHGAVVVHMQEAQLRPLVAQDKESRVGEFQYF